MTKESITVSIDFKVKVYKQGSVWVVYCKKFEIYAYGRTEKQAYVLFSVQVQEILISTKPKAPKRKKK